MLRNLLTNWKTTSAGLTSIIGSAVHLIYAVKNGEANENTWTISLTAIFLGLGLLFAGDSNKSAAASDMKAVKEQIAEVPHAINSGDTTFLSKAIDEPKPGTGVPEPKKE